MDLFENSEFAGESKQTTFSNQNWLNHKSTEYIVLGS